MLIDAQSGANTLERQPGGRQRRGRDRRRLGGPDADAQQANGNGDLGIEAVDGTIDGGKNKAAGNGNPAQCVGVSCK